MISLLLLLNILNGIPAEDINIYPTTMAVVEIDSDIDIVTCIDNSGEEWSFKGVIDKETGRAWKRGDMVSALMTDNGTSDIHDDEFITVSFEYEIHGNFGWDEEYQLPLAEFER